MSSASRLSLVIGRCRRLSVSLSAVLAAQSAGWLSAQDSPLQCDGQGCANAQHEWLFQRQRRDDAATQTPASPSAQPPSDPKTAMALPDLGRASGLERFWRGLPNGGAIWLTQDPMLGTPELTVSGSGLVAVVDGHVQGPISFYIRSNYATFIKQLELVLFRATDVDRIRPIATVSLPTATAVHYQWDGITLAGQQFRPGDRLVYLLRARDDTGHVDETRPLELQLATMADVERGRAQLLAATLSQRQRPLDRQQAEMLSLQSQAFASNGLRQQNIPINGARVRLIGQDLPQNASLTINGENYPVDQEGKFAAEFLLPIGLHHFVVNVQAPSQPLLQKTLDVRVLGQYIFGVGMADVTLYQNKTSGAGREIVMQERNDGVFNEGRLAFYLKAKTQGRYLLTAQADTQNQPLKALFTGFTTANPQDLFRSLDPDLYYPSYGDDSRTWRDVDTMGKFYVRMDWDKNQALWGNFSSGFTGTEYAQYVRSFYGAAASGRSRSTNIWGDPRSEWRLMGAQENSAPGHSEFVGTGGSLYYLRHANILQGSDQVFLEMRDSTTARTEQRFLLVRGADYEMDPIQGRLLLTKPLSQITRDQLRRISRDVPLDGYEQRLLVDYEWVPTALDRDALTVGLRGKHWLTDHVGLGATIVDENRAGDDYTLRGVDVTWRAGRGTSLTVEHSQTDATSTPVFFSDNGGMSFQQANPVGPRHGTATAVEARVNLAELGWTMQPWSAAAWWRHVDAGYSVARADTGLAMHSYGADLLASINDNLNLYARYAQTERGNQQLTQAQMTSDWRVTDRDQFTVEVRRVGETTGRQSPSQGVGVLGAGRYLHQMTQALDLYVGGQHTFANDHGRYADNDAVNVGGRYTDGNWSTVSADLSMGDRGHGALVNADYRMTTQHSWYAAFAQSPDHTANPFFLPAAPEQGLTLGQRWQLTQQTQIYQESQFLKGSAESGLAHTFGLNFYPAIGWSLGGTLGKSTLDTRDGPLYRRAVSAFIGRTAPRTDWQSKLEWRRDTGAQWRTQWVSTNRIEHTINASWRLAGRFNYADTNDQQSNAANAHFVEGNIGVAYRPWYSDRWLLWTRYTYLYDLATAGQVNTNSDYDQRSRILAMEGIYRLGHRWELAGKLAWRQGSARAGRGTGRWFNSAARLAAIQTRYELLYRWHGLVEYRWLAAQQGGVRQGWLLGVDRDLTHRLRVGIGYNFTDFRDDLTHFDYRQRGWYLNIVGRY